MMSSVISRLNDKRDAAAELGEDAGFTLIELMVVILILAILLAIAIPTFLGVTGGANDRAAQSNLNTALTTAKAMATQNNQLYVDPVQSQTAATQLAVLISNEPSIKFVSGATAVQGQISVYFDATAAGGEGVVLASPSKNGKTCWYAVDNLTNIGTANGSYGAALAPTGSATAAPSNAGTFYTSAPQTATGCDASAAPTAAVTPWKTSGF